MDECPLPRRTFLSALGVSAAGAMSMGHTGRLHASAPHTAAIKLGVASYSLRNFPREKAIEMVRALRSPYVNLKSVHAPSEASPAELAAIRAEVERAGLQIVGGGTIDFAQNSDDGV